VSGRRGDARGAGSRRITGAGCSPRAQRARLVLLVVVVAGGLLALVTRCAYLQVLKAPELLDQARSQQESTITLDPLRGPILDRNGKELAVSLDVDSAFAEPMTIGDPAAAARRLAPVLGVPASDLRARLDSDRHFVWLKRKITPEVRQRLEALRLRGVGFARESRRYYPKQTLAAHLLGACGMDNQGLGGLEFAYDSEIKGTPGQILALRDGRGGRVLDRQRRDPTTGLGLVLTVDEVIQYVVERELDGVMQATSATGAAAVVLRPATGEVLALASRPTFDPNNYPAAREEARRNRATTDFYEPGSAFKIVTAAAALDLRRVHPREVIWCENGSIVVARHRFDEDRRPFGNLTFAEVLAKSSNVGAIKVARRLAPREFMDYIRGFGFGHRTGIDLPGESPGMLRDIPEWSGLSHASLAMGQEIGVTAVQLAAMVSAIAHDGVWLRPRVVRETLSPDGGRSPGRAGEPLARRVVSQTTARTLRQILKTVTTEGTGQLAAVPGYTVGGKTGTAQKVDASGRYARGKYVSWFAGFAPADDPALAIVVMVDEPRGPKFHGGDVSAPVFSRIALPALQYLGVPPDGEKTLVLDPSANAWARAEDELDRSDTKGRTPSTLPAVRRTGAAKRARDSRTGTVRAATFAIPGRAEADDEPAGRSTMPDLTGLSLRQASETLAAAGLVCRNRLSGSRVTGQEPPPGSPIGPGVPCTVTY
jgi:cell division protein FtsI (penicillin-binding protein 3)